jgi:type II secretory pathway pseudopilin PulG
MNHRCRVSNAFSLVEVTFALGVASFCLIAVFGLLPVGIQTNRNATSQTAATGILASVIADLRATPKPPTLNSSSQYKVTFGTSTTLYFDSAGRCSIDLNGSTKPDGSGWSPNLQTRYQLNVTFPWNSGLAYGADLKVTWPAAATQATASGSSEIFAAFDRN